LTTGYLTAAAAGTESASGIYSAFCMLQRIDCRESRKSGCRKLEHFRNTRRVFRIVTGGFFFHPGDEDLSLGTLVRKKPLESMDSVYANSENAIAGGNELGCERV
jgi:hypothetical protein